MRPYQISLFIFVIIALLVIISLVFPEGGIQIFGYRFDFPAPQEMIRNKEKETIDPELILQQQELEQLDSLHHEFKDTLTYYAKAMVHPTRFYLPNDDYSFFDSFFKEAEQARGSNRVIRVLHYGDSQIELDRISINMRNYFQSVFGGSGPGLLPLYQSIPTASVYQSYSGEYTTYALYGDGSRTKSRDYGLMAKTFQISSPGSFYVSTSAQERKMKLAPYSNITLLLTHLGEQFKATLSQKGKPAISVETISEPGFQTINWRLDTALSQFSIQMNGWGNIHGVLVDGKAGVAVDNIPMRGASGTFFSQIDGQLMQQTYREINVKMIVLQFGGNSVPSIYNEKSADKYVDQILSQIDYFHRLFPDLPILFIGPSDMGTRVKGEMGTYPYLPYLVEQLKTRIPAHGAAFWNMYEVMGGENSIVAWVNKGWAGSDYVHFTPQGAQKIGEILVQSFETMYQFYKLRANNSDVDFDELFQKVK